MARGDARAPITHGPPRVPNSPPPPSAATFTTEIHSGHTQYTTGQMVGAPALMMTTYGQGRVLISPPHPEETAPRMDDLVKAYTLWAARAL